jgi:hypothetical protein
MARLYSRTARLIAKKGRDDICTICGDLPSAPYKPVNGALSLRLCDSCRKWQKQLYRLSVDRMRDDRISRPVIGD